MRAEGRHSRQVSGRGPWEDHRPRDRFPGARQRDPGQAGRTEGPSTALAPPRPPRTLQAPQPRCPRSLHGAAGAWLSRSRVPPADLKRQLDSTASPLTSHSGVWSWDLHSHDLRQPCVSRAACQRAQNTLNEQKCAARGHLCKVCSGPRAESTPHQASRQLCWLRPRHGATEGIHTRKQ